MTRTSAPAWRAPMTRSIAARSWLLLPNAWLFVHFTAMIGICQPTPVMPMPSLPAAATRPATRVPWLGVVGVVVHRIARGRGGEDVEPVRAGRAAADAGVRPHPRGQIRMGVVHAAVQHGDDLAAAADGAVPRRQHADVGPGRARHAVHRLAAVRRPPLHGEGGIVRRRRRAQDEVRLGVADAARAAQRGDDRADAAARDPQHVRAGAHDADLPRARGSHDGAPAVRADPAREADEHPVGRTHRPGAGAMDGRRGGARRTDGRGRQQAGEREREQQAHGTEL